MAKIDLDSLSIEELAALREHATDKLLEKVAARQAELEAELEKLSQYGKPVRKSPAVRRWRRPGRADEKKVEKDNDANSGEIKEAVAKAA